MWGQGGVVEGVEGKNIWVGGYEDVEGEQVKGNVEKQRLVKFVGCKEGTWQNEGGMVSVGDEVVKGEIVGEGG